MPRLSVLMPAFNAEQTIASAVLSTLRNLPRDSELVVLDDASSDNTLLILERISAEDSRLVVHSEPQNLGAAGALRKLLGETDSDFIARMDADDLVLPGRFALQMAAAANTDITFMTVVHHWPEAKKRIGKIAPSLPFRITDDAMPYHLLVVNPVAHSTMFARREAIEGLGGYRSVPAEDYDLWLRAATNGVRMVRLAPPGIAYRHHASQITASAGWAKAAATDEQTKLAYESLARAVTGSDHRVFEYLRGNFKTSEAREALIRLSTAIAAASRDLSLEQRFVLQQTLRKVSHRIKNSVPDAEELETRGRAGEA
jgi:GT2 family glycosyltransferase